MLVTSYEICSYVLVEHGKRIEKERKGTGLRLVSN